MAQTDIIVIGGGVLGAFHAYFAAKQGCRVRLLEQQQFPSDASVRNFGMLPQTIVPTEGLWAEIARDSATIYRELQAEHDLTVSTSGSLYLASTGLEDTVLREFAQISGLNYQGDYLSADEVRYRYPVVRQSYCAGGLLFPSDLSLDPARMLRRFIPYLERAFGVKYNPAITAIGVAAIGTGCEVLTSSGLRLTADRVIVCSGAECRLLFPAVLRESGFQICKLQMMRTEPQPSMAEARAVLSLPSVLSGLSIRRYPAFAICPSYAALLDEPLPTDLTDAGIHVLLKRTADGSFIIGDSHQYRAVGERLSLEERTDPKVNNSILAYARRMLDVPTWQVAELWNGFHLSHPEEPILAVDIAERIHLVTGIGGKGMTTSPGLARRSIARVLGELRAD